MKQPIPDKVKGLRQRQRSDGTWRIWWEPNKNERSAGLVAEELDANKLTWSRKRAEQLNETASSVLKGEIPKAKKIGSRTVSALIKEYESSVRFRKTLSASTRKNYRKDFKFIEKKWGDTLVIEFTKPVMSTWYETLHEHHGSHYAFNTIHAFSALFSYAENKLGWRPENSNPCHNLKMEQPPARSRVANWDEIDALLDAAIELELTAMHCAITLAFYTGQRAKDVYEAKINAFRKMRMVSGEPVFAWELVRSKRKNYDALPLHDEAQPVIMAQIDRAHEDQVFLLHDEATRQPYTESLFNKRWRAIRTLAAKRTPSLLEEGQVLQFRDLRRTFSTFSRMAGASKEDIGDILGNSAGYDPHIGEVYMPPTAEATRRAINAVQRPKRRQA